MALLLGVCIRGLASNRGRVRRKAEQPMELSDFIMGIYRRSETSFQRCEKLLKLVHHPTRGSSLASNALAKSPDGPRRTNGTTKSCSELSNAAILVHESLSADSSRLPLEYLGGLTHTRHKTHIREVFQV